VLSTSDALANVTTLLILVLGFIRMYQQLPQHGSMQGAFLGPERPFFHMTFAIPAYALTSVWPMLWLYHRPSSYFEHRTAVVTAIRLMRLMVQLLTMLSPLAVEHLAAIIADRMSHKPHHALGMVLGHPLAFYLQHSLFLLPWRRALLFQVVSTATLLNWVWVSPCFLQHAQAHISAQPWQDQAAMACSSMQSVAAILRTAVGAPLSELSYDICTGQHAVQVLQLFCALSCLLVVPVTACYLLERCVRRRYQQQQQQQQAQLTQQQQHWHDPLAGTTSTLLAGASSSRSLGAEASSSHAGMSSSAAAAAATSSTRTAAMYAANSSSSSNQWGASAEGSYMQPTGRSIHQLTVRDMVELTCGGQEAAAGGSVTCLVVLVLPLVLPVIWLLCEALTQVFAANRHCCAGSL
jgi:hypothetical protein